MPSARMLHIALDSCDAGIAQDLAAAGQMPTLAKLLEEAATVETIAPPGLYVSGAWVTFATGRDIPSTTYHCWGQVDGGTYNHRWTSPRDVVGVPYWERLSDAGLRVAALDVPHALVPESINGAVVVEWGGHDCHHGTASTPPELVAELDRVGGPHFRRSCPPPYDNPNWSACDFTERAGEIRTAEEEARFLDLLQAAIDARRRASLHLLEREPWDAFITVLAESHCVGHQFWHVHDETYPRHDPEVRAAIGDPIVDVYARLDAVLAEHLAKVGDTATVYVHLTHGMQAHYDGEMLLDPLLDRLDRSLDGPQGGWQTRAAGAVLRALPAAMVRVVEPAVISLIRRKAARAPRSRKQTVRRALEGRRWFRVDNNTVIGAVRFNLEGREPAGRIGRDELDSTVDWLKQELCRVINVDTGRPAVTNVWHCDDAYRRDEGDSLPDLFVEWDRSAPVDRVWSPRTGLVAVPYDGSRTGDHNDRGLLLVRGRGVEPGRRSEPLRAVDLAPTIAASLGVELRDVDGQPRPDLVALHAPIRAAST